ncbi:MAG TPA: hypothetical protein VHJ20_04105, partial [Polyangia bacterium]|nr:hypothetical protein [Polyangia bacterium]
MKILARALGVVVMSVGLTAACTDSEAPYPFDIGAGGQTGTGTGGSATGGTIGSPNTGGDPFGAGGATSSAGGTTGGVGGSTGGG